MKKITITLLILFNTITVAEEKPSTHNIELSPALVELLREEMRALQADVQTLPAHIAAANWKGIADIGANMSASYIMAQKLTEKQTHELHNALPEYFKKLDADFHAEATRLEKAAYNHDAQLVTFHFYRLIETCTACHSDYATGTFPGFKTKSKASHQH